jgi:copper chaperone NosL
VAAAQEPDENAIGYYCHMVVAEHEGPKGQIFLDGKTTPIWFSSVRDTLAFTMLPEEPKTIAVIYVNDMAKASWDKPEPGTWIEAQKAVYVVGSSRQGAMGGSEVVPFSAKDAAETFAARYGGRLTAFADIPKDAVLGDKGAPVSQ